MTFFRSKLHDPRPLSASSHMIGLVGLISLVGWIAFCRNIGAIGEMFGWAGLPERAHGPYAALISVAVCALPMIIWSILVDKVHRRKSTGLDWTLARPVAETLDVSIVKLAGYWATWAALAAAYMLLRWYWEPPYTFAMQLFEQAAVPLAALSIPYVVWVDRHMVEPTQDAVWHVGAWIAGKPGWKKTQIIHHARSWLVKGFFLAFMLSIVPGGFEQLVMADFSAAAAAPTTLAFTLITAMFVIDVQLATVGYIFTLRPLDSHIRSANPLLAGWVAALACYPPFTTMITGQVFDYQVDTTDWTYWFREYEPLLWLWGAMLVVLTAIYAWATMAFGLRFSNLTNRGIITHGPYALSKHPAYVSKVVYWWLLTLPFLTTSGSLIEGVRNTAMIMVVTLIYYWRARTEEAHLRSEEPVYAEYEAWMARNAPWPRFIQWLRASASAIFNRRPLEPAE